MESDRGFGLIWIRYLFGVLYTNFVASVEVILILRMVAGSRVHVFAALVISLATAIASCALTAAKLSSALAWYRRGQTPTAEQRASASMLPFRLARVQGAVWAAVGVSLLALHYDAGGQVLSLIGICMAVVAVATGFMNFLLLQRLLRPVFGIALADVTDLRRRRHRVGVRLLVTWGLYSAIPLAGITALVLASQFRWLIPSGATTTTPVLILAGVGIVAGLRGMTLAARSVADPLREVTDGMGHVGAGRYEVRTPVYDSSEIGYLQIGFNEMVAGLAEREQLRDLFGRHVGRDVAQHALQQGQDFTGRVCEAGVVFIDLAGSTALAATSSPDHVAAVLNAFFRIVVGIIGEYGGYINKFEGDAALAIFGAPLTLGDPCAQALGAARAMREALTADRDMPDFGIGVTYGRVFAGNIGAEDRYEYTVIGDPVNEAARLSDLAKSKAGRLLASAVTVSRSGPDEATCWLTGEDVLLRGRHQPTTLAEPNGIA
ncbi:MAG TPA: adenylate/guanylate cyclase domain-containing protein [Mycobacterium sp.]|nr:adenylate/guanylate cyclase domain-containing protein [Mycobacterium sp.]